MPQPPVGEAIPCSEPVLVREHQQPWADQHGRAVEVEAVRVARVHLVAPRHVAVRHPQRHQRARPRSAAHRRPVRGAGADVDEPQDAVDRRRRQHAAPLAAGRRHRRAPQPHPVGQPVGGDPPARRRQLGPRARADEHHAADDRRRTPEVVVAELRPDRRGRPDRRAAMRIKAAHAVGRHHRAAAVHRDAAEEPQLTYVGAAAVRRRPEAPPPPPVAVGHGERRDLAAQRRRDRDPAGQRRGAGHAAREIGRPPLVQHVRRGRRAPRPEMSCAGSGHEAAEACPASAASARPGSVSAAAAPAAPFRNVARLIPGCLTTSGLYPPVARSETHGCGRKRVG